MSKLPGCAHKGVALVTGSATGIGADIAIKLAAEGYFVVVTGRNETSMRRVVAECDRVATGTRADNSSAAADAATTMTSGNSLTPGPSAAWFKADLLDSKQIDELIEFVKVKFKRIDVLVNNACWRGEFKGLTDSDCAYDDFKRVMQLNVSVPIYLTHRCLVPLSIANAAPKAASHQDAGDSRPPIVINMSSISGQVVVPLHSYSISKACLTEFTRQLSQSDVHELTGLLCVTVSPGPVLTNEKPHHATMSNMTLLNRVGTTKEVANLVVFAISNARLFHGRELTIDGGYVSKQRKPEITTN